MIYNVTTFTKNKIFEVKFSPDINKLGCKPSREKKKFFSACIIKHHCERSAADMINLVI